MVYKKANVLVMGDSGMIMNIKWVRKETIEYMHVNNHQFVAYVHNLGESPYEAIYFHHGMSPDGRATFISNITNEFDTLADAKHWCEMMYNTGA
jgi:hypothetical protein